MDKHDIQREHFHDHNCWKCSSSKNTLVHPILRPRITGVYHEEEEDFDEASSISFEKQDDQLCAPEAQCLPLDRCPLLQDLMDQSCLATDRLGRLTCGYKGKEVLMCCPKGGHKSPFINHHSDNAADASFLKKRFSCGQTLFNDKKMGSKGGLGSHPWVVRVGYKSVKTGAMSYPCCGSIISERTILTAAHCALAKADNFQLSSVRIGEYDGKGNPDCTSSFCAHPVQDIAISHILVHPGFDKKIFKHDVALIILKSPMNFSVAAMPICLLKNPDVPLVGRRGSLVGWGKLPGQSVTPTREQLLELPIVPLENCNRIYSKVIPITQNQMCVGGEEGKDACSGFGGAPLVLLDHITQSRYYQVGIASFGSDKCGTAGVPSVYSSVHRYADWVQANMV